MAKTKKIIIANWKMGPSVLSAAKEIVAKTKSKVRSLKKVNVVICPPAIFISSLASSFLKSGLSLGGQNVFTDNSGAFTGEVSPLMLKNIGAKYVIVGHSERRKLGETNEVINQKLRLILKTGLIAILCVGEAERDHQAGYLEFIKSQLESALRAVDALELKKIIIAYEPVWAIGDNSKGPMTPEDLHEMTIFIRKVVADLYTHETAMAVNIIYGGSVSPATTKELLLKGEADGLLVGRDSLVAEDFNKILEIANEI